MGKLIIALTLATVALSAPANLENQANIAGKNIQKKIQQLARKNNINLQAYENQVEASAKALAKYLEDNYPNRVNSAKTQIENAKQEAQQLVAQNKNQSAKKHFQKGVALAKEQCNNIPQPFDYLIEPCLEAIKQAKNAVKNNVDLNKTYQEHVNDAKNEAAELAKANQKNLNQALKQI